MQARHTTTPHHYTNSAVRFGDVLPYKSRRNPHRRSWSGWRQRAFRVTCGLRVENEWHDRPIDIIPESPGVEQISTAYPAPNPARRSNITRIWTTELWSFARSSKCKDVPWNPSAQSRLGPHETISLKYSIHIIGQYPQLNHRHYRSEPRPSRSYRPSRSHPTSHTFGTHSCSSCSSSSSFPTPCRDTQIRSNGLPPKHRSSWRPCREEQEERGP